MSYEHDELPEFDGPDSDLEREFSLAHPEVHFDDEQDDHMHIVGDTQARKRRRTPSPSPTPRGETMHDLAVPSGAYLDSETYGAARFGELGEYMRRKRLKQKIQDKDLLEGISGDGSASGILKGVSIYINGYTEPSNQTLRQLILKHGGVYQPYLDQKAIVTHIITTSLTPAKVREFKNMKVVTPGWITDSIQQGVLLNWRDYTFRPGQRVDDTQGRSSTQRSLFPGAKAGSRPRPSSAQHETRAQIPTGHPDPPGDRPSAPTSPAAGPSAQTPTLWDALYTSDPAEPAEPVQAARVSGYAPPGANPNAQRAMADAQWRAAHTSAAPDFIDGYYKNSRLHWLSTWKVELRNMVAEAQDRAEAGAADVAPPTAGSQKSAYFAVRVAPSAKGKGKGKEKAGAAERVIMHCDFDSFFVSVGLLDRPELVGKPTAVCHSQGAQGGVSSTSEIASASYAARAFGVKAGMSLQQARRLCPGIITIPYEFEKYKKLSTQFYAILMSHADDLQAVSVDEALIDVTSRVRAAEAHAETLDDHDDVDYARELAEMIRAQIHGATGCTASIGIAHNIMLARLATSRAKPDGSFHLLPDEVPGILDGLDLDNLHGFGYHTRQKAVEKLGSAALNDLLAKSKGQLCEALGKGTGETLYKALRGVDDRKLESDKPRKSVSCDINYGIRFETDDAARTFIYTLAEKTSERLDAVPARGSSLTLKLMKRHPDAPKEAPKFMGHGRCETFSKQTPLAGPDRRPTRDPKLIGDHAYKLLRSFGFDPTELRGISIQIQKLELGTAGQPPAGQARLPFKRTEALPKPATTSSSSFTEPTIPPQAPPELVAAIEHPVIDLPSFSQVDMDVYNSLPDELRGELKAAYQQRDEARAAAAMAVERSRPATPEPVAGPSRLGPPRSPVKVGHIIQQLAPKRSAVSPSKSGLFTKDYNLSALGVSEAELRKLDIDVDVFAALPREFQREQLSVARHIKAGGKLDQQGARKVLKAVVKRARGGSPGNVFVPPPPPKAMFPDPPRLPQTVRDEEGKKQKVFLSSADEVQAVMERWVASFTANAPYDKDVNFFADFLLKSVDSGPGRGTDAGIETAVKIMQWWRLLLRRHWAAFEQEPVSAHAESVGAAWWRAFRDVKAKMDVIARKRFGGSLSLR